MTRKDYVRLAEALHTALTSLQLSSCGANPADIIARSGVRLAATHIADALQADNPRFDRERFMQEVNR